MGIFGTKATLFSDLSLIIEIIIVSIFIYGATFARKKLSDRHHKLMLTGFSLNLLFVLSYMIYSGLFKSGAAKFAGSEEVRKFVYLPMVITHGTASTIAFILAGYAAYYGIKHSMIKKRRIFPSKDEREKHAKIGRATIYTWAIALITGVLVYILLYVVY